MNKEESNVYLEEINDKQDEINKLREQLSESMIDNWFLIRSAKDNELKIKQAIEYIWSTKYEWGDLEEDNEDFDIDVYKLLDILEGGNNDK